MVKLESTARNWGVRSRIINHFSLRWNAHGKPLNVHICTQTFKVAFCEPEIYSTPYYISLLSFILESSVFTRGEWRRVISNLSLRWNALGKKNLYVHICTLTFKVAYWEPESCKIWEARWINRSWTTYFFIIFAKNII